MTVQGRDENDVDRSIDDQRTVKTGESTERPGIWSRVSSLLRRWRRWLGGGWLERLRPWRPWRAVPHSRRCPRNRELDPAWIVSRYSIAERARQDALLERPSAEATERPSLEHEIRNMLEEQGRVRHGRRRAAVQIAARRLHDLDRADPEPLMQKEIERFETVEARDVLHRATDRITSAHQIYRQVCITLRGFQTRHRLARPAREPNPILVTLLLVVSAVLVEAFVNGHFLQDASAFGMLMGWVYAGGFALVNVGVSLAAGFLALRRLTVRPKDWRTLLAMTGLVVYAASALSAHGLFVAFRHSAQEAGDFTEALTAAPALLAADPLFWTSDISAMTLLGIGLLISILGCLEGVYAFSDPHPGYLALSRRKARAAAALHAAVDEARDEIDDAHAEAEDHVIELAGDLRAALAGTELLRAEVEEQVAEHMADRLQLAKVLSEVMAVYWSEQRAVRGEISPLPAWADEPVSPIEMEADLGPEAVLQRAGEIETRLTSIIGRRPETRLLERLATAQLASHAQLSELFDPSGSRATSSARPAAKEAPAARLLDLAPASRDSAA